MKLYNCKPKSFVKLLDDGVVPPAAPELKKGDVIFFDHVDGMYSYCKKDGHIVHLAAYSEVDYV